MNQRLHSGFLILALLYLAIACESHAQEDLSTEYQLLMLTSYLQGCTAESDPVASVKTCHQYETPVIQNSSKPNQGSITFIERHFEGLDGSQRITQSLKFTSPKPDLLEVETSVISSTLVAELFTQVFNLPRLNQDQHDFDYLKQFLQLIPANESIELFLRVPELHYRPAIHYQGIWLALPQLTSEGSLWFPGDNLFDSLLMAPGKIIPLDTRVIEYLANALVALDIHTPSNSYRSLSSHGSLINCDSTQLLCSFQLEFSSTQADLFQKALPLSPSGHLIALGNKNSMAALSVSGDGLTLELVYLHEHLQYLDVPAMSYLPCSACNDRVNTALIRKYSQPATLIRLMGMFSHNGEQHEGQPDDGEPVQAEVQPQPPGDGPDAPALNSPNFSTVVPVVQFGGSKSGNSNSKGKSGKGSQSSGKGPSRGGKDKDKGDGHKKQRGSSGAGHSGGSSGGSGDAPTKGEKQSFKELISQKAKSMLKSFKQIHSDLKLEKEYFLKDLKLSKKDKPPTLTRTEFNRQRLKPWITAVRAISATQKMQRAATELEDHEVYDKNVEEAQHSEEFFFHPETKTLITNGARRISVPVRMEGNAEPEHAITAVDVKHQQNIGRMAMSGNKRVSGIARADVEKLQKQVESEKALWDKPVSQMTRSELAAARDKINNILTDELTLREDQLTLLDQGRIELYHKLGKRKDELTRLNQLWFGGASKQINELQKAVVELQNEAKQINEFYAHQDGYNQYYRHWSVAMLKEVFYSEAAHRRAKLDQAQKQFLHVADVSIVSAHWRRVAAHQPTAGPVFRRPPPLDETDAPAASSITRNKLFAIGIGSGLTTLASAVYYYWQEIPQYFTDDQPEEELRLEEINEDDRGD